MSRRPKTPPDPARRDEDDDARLWAQIARSVTPLKKAGGRAPDKALSGPAAKERAAGSVRKAAPEAKTPKKRTQPPTIGGDRPAEPPIVVSKAPGGLQHGDTPGVDKRTAARFKRGLMPIEATLDLHGHTRDSAQSALTAFLQAHQGAGRRCVLVITGKGLKGEDWSPGVIREAVPGWLNTPPLRSIVLSFAYAQPQHGGSGALYVLLKRNR